MKPAATNRDTKPSPPHRGEHGGRRDVTTATILDAAERLFSERGYAAVSVRDIGYEAGVSHALVHRYLGAKKDVYRAVMMRHQDTIREALGDTENLNDAIARGIHHALGEHRPYLRLIVLSALQGLPFATAGGRAPAVQRLIELAASEAHKAAPRGEPQLPPRIAVAAVVTLLLGWSALEPWIVPGTGLDALDEAAIVAGVAAMALAIAALLESPPEAPRAAPPAAAAKTGGGRLRGLSRRQLTAAAILDAAETLFAEKGYAAVSVRDIGARAGVSHALVHRYLGSKQDVYHAVLQRNEDAILRAAGGSEDLVEAIRLMLRAGLRDRRRYLCIIAQSAVQGIPFATSIGRFPATSRLVELAEARCAADLGQETHLTPRFVIAAIVALYIGWIAAQPWIVPAAGLQDLDEAARDSYLEQIVLGLVDRLLPPCASPAANLAGDDAASAPRTT